MTTGASSATDVQADIFGYTIREYHSKEENLKQDDSRTRRTRRAGQSGAAFRFQSYPPHCRVFCHRQVDPPRHFSSELFILVSKA